MRLPQANSKVDLPRYLVEMLQGLGAEVQSSDDYHTLEALLPEELARSLDCETYLRVALDYETAREEDLQFVTFGSPLLDRIASEGCSVGRVLQRWVQVGSVRVPDGLTERIESTIGFSGCRPPVVEELYPVELGYALFEFRVSLYSDEKVEWVEEACVDLQRGAVKDGFDELKNALEADEPQAVLSVAPQMPITNAYRAARQRIDRLTTERKTAYERQTASRKQTDLDTMNRYYDELGAGLKRRLARTQDADKQAQLRSKLEVNEQDRLRHQQDVEDKHRATVEAELDRLVWIRVPGVRAVIRVERRDKAYQLEAYYNLYTHEVEAPLCEVCHRAERLTIGPDGSPACPDHAPI